MRLKTREDQRLVYFRIDNNPTEYCCTKTAWALAEKLHNLHEKYGVPEAELEELKWDIIDEWRENEQDER